jgi:hypothetical protein
MRDARYLHNGVSRHTVSSAGLYPENSRSERFPADPIDIGDTDPNRANRGVQTSYNEVREGKSVLGGLVVSMLASGTQVRGFKPQEVTIPNKPDAILAADTARWHCQYFSVQ